MTTRSKLLSVLLSVSAIRAGTVPPPSGPSGRPDVILILADDLGYGDLGFTGNPVLRTPHLDAMAERSARMSAFYVTPFCGPTRAALLTGRYPHRSGVHSNGEEMASSAVTLAELLQSAGYATGIFGKWHLGQHHPRRAMDQGFEESLVSRGGFIGELAPVPDDLGRYRNPVLERNGRLVELEGYATGATFDACLDWIEAMRGEERNYFAYLPVNVPHRPFDQVPEELYRALLERMVKESPGEDAGELDDIARAYAMVEDLDANVGRLFERLAALDALEDTLVIFLSDNGANGHRFGAGLSGIKGSVYEGGLRTVFLAHGPALFEPGTSSDRIAAHIDLVPTLLDLCGVSAAEELELDGRSLLPLLRGEEADWPERRLFFEGHKGSEVRPRHNFAVRTQRWKLVRSGIGLPRKRFDGDGTSLAGAELFDLVADPLEERDLLADHPDVARSLRAAYEELALEIDAVGERAQPQGRIRLGLSEEDPVLLTHANWERISPAADGSERRRDVVQTEAIMGLRSVAPASYDVVLRFPPVPRTTSVFLSLRKQGKAKGSLTERSAEVPEGATEVRIEAIELERARYELLALVGASRALGRPVWQIELRRR